MAVLLAVLLSCCGGRSDGIHGDPTRRAFEELTSREEWSRTGFVSGSGLCAAEHQPTGLTFLLVPAGRFEMGSAEGELDELPVHSVQVEPFLLCVTECTQRAWDRLGGEDERRWRGADLPIEGVSWENCRDWSARAGLRLPTEAEWEYACRAGATVSRRPAARSLPDEGWFFRNSGARTLPVEVGWSAERVLGEWACRTHPVGGKAANPWGFRDMRGNVWEWCQDRWHDDYSGAPTDGSAWLDGHSPILVYRGGGWGNSESMCRSSFRSGRAAEFTAAFVGFRPAATLPVYETPGK